MIKIEGLWKRYHNQKQSPWVLKDINLTIPFGVSVGLVGQNGAGKSTLLRLIGDMDIPERGRITRDCRVSWPIGLSGGFQPTMTGRENVKFIARIHGGEGAVKPAIKFVEDFAEIGAAFDEPVETYSSGMKSRLSFGVSLAFDFDVYLSDEATAVGDALFKKKASNLFKSRVGKSSLIMVSHSEGILRELCQSGIWLHKGEALWYDKIDDALEAYKIFRDSGRVMSQSRLLSARDGVELQGRLGGVSKNARSIFGWARNAVNPQEPLVVKLYKNSSLIGKLQANQPRKDLDERFDYPCAFNLILSESDRIAYGDCVTAIIEKNGQELPNSPVVFSGG